MSRGFSHRMVNTRPPLGSRDAEGGREAQRGDRESEWVTRTGFREWVLREQYQRGLAMPPMVTLVHAKIHLPSY